jgi:hypothetical protein
MAHDDKMSLLHVLEECEAALEKETGWSHEEIALKELQLEIDLAQLRQAYSSVEPFNHPLLAAMEESADE